MSPRAAASSARGRTLDSLQSAYRVGPGCLAAGGGRRPARRTRRAEVDEPLGRAVVSPYIDDKALGGSSRATTGAQSEREGRAKARQARGREGSCRMLARTGGG